MFYALLHVFKHDSIDTQQASGSTSPGETEYHTIVVCRLACKGT